MCKVRNLSPRDYLAGLWRQDLPGQLLWIAQNPCRTKSESLPYIAPSWSWASLGKPNLHMDGFQEGMIMADLVDVSMFLKTTDPYGGLIGGCIRLRGPMCKLNSRISPSIGAVEIGRHGTYYQRSIITTDWDYVTLPEYCSSFEDQKRQCQNIITPPQMYLFLISVYEYLESLSGLILQPIDEVKGRYRRLGCFEINTAKVDFVGSKFDFFLTNTLDDDEFICFEEPNMYVIDII
jgi:hypothetical protein